MTGIRLAVNEKKSTEAASVFLHLNGGAINHMKLIKLLYLADRKALEEWERPITYDQPYSMPNGQVLTNILDFIKSTIRGSFWKKYIARSDLYHVQQIERIELQELSEAEVEVIEGIYAEYGHLDQFTLGKITSAFPEYVPTGGSSIETPVEKILKALGNSEKDIERISFEINEEADIAELLGA